jgi:ABC-type multidrug transport system permease subunit
MVAFIALGTLVGTIVRRRQAAVPLSLATTLPLFFMSGPFGPPNWLGPVAGSLAKVSPLYYAIAIFQHAFHGYQTSQSSALANTLALLGFAAVAIWLTTFVLRRSEVAR